MFGKASGFAANIDLSSLDGSNGFKLSGVAASDCSGCSVASAGDVNGDGFADLIVGARGADPHGNASGASYVVFGKASGFAANLDLSIARRHQRLQAQRRGGATAAALGRLGGRRQRRRLRRPDRRRQPTPIRTAPVPARATWCSARPRASPPTSISRRRSTAPTASSSAAWRRTTAAGCSVASAGDVNGDGFADLIVGARCAEPAHSGASYVVFGKLPDTAVNRTGTDAAQTLAGGDFNDTLAGLGGDDTLYGNGGNDTLDGGAGNDTMLGGAGNDTYVVDSALDVVTEALNEGTDTVQASVTYTLSANVENLTLTGSGNINGTGNALDNVITSNTGVDLLAGGAGNDTYVVNNINDVVIEAANAGTDEVRTELASYSLAAIANVENLTGAAATGQTLTGNSLANTITGGIGNDTLDGGTGNDTLVGGAGDDSYVRRQHLGRGHGSRQRKAPTRVQSSVTYTLAANVENLTLTGSGNINGTGNGDANIITGNAGNNTLTGLGGNDIIDGRRRQRHARRRRRQRHDDRRYRR